MFRLGSEIVVVCQLTPPSYERSSTANKRKKTVSRLTKKPAVIEETQNLNTVDSPTSSDEDNSGTDVEDDNSSSSRHQKQNTTYRKKKQMFDVIVKFAINSTPSQQASMHIS